MKFPPESAKPRLDAIRKARAWWSGEDLPKHSGEPFWTAEAPLPGVQWTDSAMRPEHRVHVPIAADLALVSADYIFGGGIELDDDANELAEAIGLHTLAPTAAEKASGMGEVYLRWGWRDETVPMLTIVDADRVVPTWSWGRLVAADVWAELEKHNGFKWAHMEEHRPGVISHRLYKITTGDWIPSSLTSHPETSGLAPRVPLPAPLAGRLAIVDIINAQPKVRRKGGASDTEGSESIMAGVDESWSSMQRDIRLGKGRVVVPEWMLTRTNTSLGGVYFDNSAEVFSPVGSGGGDESPKDAMTAIQFALRITEHLDAVRDGVQRIVSSGGYSPESLIANRQQLPEAAAARRLRETASLRTTQRKIKLWRPALAEVLSSLLVVARNLPAVPDVSVSIRSSFAPDVAETANVVQALTAGRAASIETKVRMLHPTWTPTEVADEVAKIREDGGGGADVPRMLQQLYLAVGKVITIEEARAIANQGGAGLTGPGPVVP